MSDKKLFYKGAMLGILGGVIGDIWSTAVYDWALMLVIFQKQL